MVGNPGGEYQKDERFLRQMTLMYLVRALATGAPMRQRRCRRNPRVGTEFREEFGALRGLSRHYLGHALSWGSALSSLLSYGTSTDSTRVDDL